MMYRKMFLIFAAAAFISGGMTGCSMLIRQNPPKSAPAPEKKTALQPKKQAEASSGELTAEQLLAMTPEQLQKYHAEKRAKQEREEAVARQRAARQTQTAKERKSSSDLVNSFMSDRPSREKRRRLGDMSRQLDYSETSVFPWRDGRRSESLNRRY